MNKEDSKEEPKIPIYDLEGQYLGHGTIEQYTGYNDNIRKMFEEIKPKLKSDNSIVPILYGTGGNFDGYNGFFDKLFNNIVNDVSAKVNTPIVKDKHAHRFVTIDKEFIARDVLQFSLPNSNVWSTLPKGEYLILTVQRVIIEDKDYWQYKLDKSVDSINIGDLCRKIHSVTKE